MGAPEATLQQFDDRFAVIWEDNDPCAYGSTGSVSVAAGLDAMYEQFTEQESLASILYITDVTLRDGQQQRTVAVTHDQRVEVFDHIVSTGIDRVEIGHLGNARGDQQLASALVKHIAAREKEDQAYQHVKLQVLFGSQLAQIQQGSQVLINAFQENYPDSWEQVMAERVVVHVYDRGDPALTATASKPYDLQQSASRVALAAEQARQAGFKHFSVSAEAATAIAPEDAIHFYRSVTGQLLESGVETVNVNLANTYGYSPHKDWNSATLAVFNHAVKYGFDGKVTTSIHTHNDVDNAVGFSVSAIAAGFDRLEGTHIGMGERSGNVASVDVMARILEAARHQILDTQREAERPLRIAEAASHMILRRTVRVDPQIVSNLANWHRAGKAVAEIFGPEAMYRWHNTTLGNPYAHDNGSGPHDQVMAAAIKDPVEHPADRTYEWMLLVNDIMGRPDAMNIALGDPVAVDGVTVGNHAGGSKTDMIKRGGIKRASPAAIQEAEAMLKARKQAILTKIAGSVLVYAA